MHLLANGKGYHAQRYRSASKNSRKRVAEDILNEQCEKFASSEDTDRPLSDEEARYYPDKE